MPTPRKEQLVAELTELIEQAEIAIATSVTGVSVSEQADLRRQLREQGAQLRVVKNTLLRIAATNADAEVFAELADGPTALVVGYDEPIGPARGIAGYIDDTPGTPVEIRNAVVAGALVDADYVRDLATVPPRDELLARIAGGLVGKIRELMMLLEATTRDFAGLIEARAVQLEEEGGEAPAAEESSDDAPAADEASDDAPVADASDETTDDEAVDDEAASDEASDEADEDSSEDEAAEASEESADGEEQGAE